METYRAVSLLLRLINGVLRGGGRGGSAARTCQLLHICHERFASHVYG